MGSTTSSDASEKERSANNAFEKEMFTSEFYASQFKIFMKRLLFGHERELFVVTSKLSGWRLSYDESRILNVYEILFLGILEGEKYYASSGRKTNYPDIVNLSTCEI